ncbi:alanine racemase [Candidatus Francisella endociliophora]|uniref:Alanine racemase n=1 Tax=Candidatus Francisella endociliophora TaxID=653937 RepID=A0A097ERE9_9GAMM|nr:alanine racemase [Francisella sp. FSC1006]AIT10148.1 alanine racemase [Francisella sp. FSC1006]
MDVNFLELNISTLRNNISIIKEYTQTKFCLPVKANAYGHGLQNIVRNTSDIVDFYAIACAREALEVYEVSSMVPILIFGVVEDEYLEELILKGIRISIHRFKDIDKIEFAAKKCSKIANVHIFINTGMNMLGIDCKHAEDIIQKARRSEWLNLEGVFSHLACADENNHPFNKLQIDRFKKVYDFTKSVDNQIICHLANSYGCIGQANISFDMVRAGILSYGFLPKFKVDNVLQEIRPIAKLTTKVIKIIDLEDMLEVGYSVSYTGQSSETIAILPIGYGDGLPRELGNIGVVYIKDRKYPIVGKINMDALAISLGSNTDKVKVGCEVELISDNPSMQNSAKSLAKKLKTIEYDIITTLNQRVVRRDVIVK